MRLKYILSSDRLLKKVNLRELDTTGLYLQYHDFDKWPMPPENLSSGFLTMQDSNLT